MASSSRKSPGASVEDVNATPAKQMKLDEHLGHKLGDQELLKLYETLESKVRKVLNTMYDKLTKSLPQDNMSEEIKYLKDCCQTLKEISLDSIYIGLIGRTGAGKSSLLNALIDHRFFLPVSGSGTCTSCMLQVNSGRGENYEAKIHLLSPEEWEVELKNLVELVKRPEEQNREEKEVVEKENDVSGAVQKLRALYGRDAETRSYGDLLTAKPLVNIPSSNYILFEEAQAQELSDKLDPYIRCDNDQDEEEPAQDKERAKKRIWPLIKYVEVTIPKSDIIPEGVVFVDVPGKGDYNKERDEMWKESINKCSVIWVISDIKRIFREKDHAELLRESIKAYQAGICNDIALVVTQTDNLDLEEYQRERKNKQTPIETEHDAIVERNKSVKEKKHITMKKDLESILSNDSDILCKRDLVYTVSAKEYWKAMYLSQEETGIPDLRQYVTKICLKEKKKILMNYVAEALGIVLLAKIFSSTQDTLNHYQQSDLEAFMDEKIKALEKDIEKCFAQLDQPLTEGVNCAKSSCQRTLSVLLEPGTSNQGFHRTLKAVCQRNGVYASRIFSYIDFNSTLAEPIYDNIDHIFAQIFRSQMRDSLKSCLDMFKDSVEKKIQELEKTSPVPNDNSKHNFLIQQTNIILNKQEKEISKKRMVIYDCLPLSIQSDLQPYYEEAFKLQGKDSCQKMKNLLKENIEKETKDRMFERAKKRMTKLLQDLKNDIVENLKRDISTMLTLAFSHQEELTKRLPDLQNEYEEIDQILKTLKKCEVLKRDTRNVLPALVIC